MSAHRHAVPEKTAAVLLPEILERQRHRPFKAQISEEADFSECAPGAFDNAARSKSCKSSCVTPNRHLASQNEMESRLVKTMDFRSSKNQRHAALEMTME